MRPISSPRSAGFPRAGLRPWGEGGYMNKSETNAASANDVLQSDHHVHMSEEEIAKAKAHHEKKQGGEDVQRLGCGDSSILGGPFLLVEGLDRGSVFGQGLSQAEGEDDFAVGKMADDFRGAPLAGRGRRGRLGRPDRFNEAGKGGGRGGKDFVHRAAVKKFA